MAVPPPGTDLSEFSKSVGADLFTNMLPFQRELIRMFESEVDRRIRTLLGCWVSELEPEVICGPRHEILGLGYAGTLVVRYEGPKEYFTFKARK